MTMTEEHEPIAAAAGAGIPVDAAPDETPETALDILGTAGELAGEQWMDGYLFALSGPIYAGTNEVQKNIIAERLLGLPRG